MDREITQQVALNYLPFVGGAVWCFVLGPILLLFGPRLMRARGPAWPEALVAKTFRRVVVSGMLLGAAVMLQGFLLRPGPWEGSRIMRRVLSASAETIVSADIISWGRNNSRAVAARPLLIRDPGRLKELCDCLHAAESWKWGHAPTIWECKLTLRHEDVVDTCLVEKIDTDEGVVLLHIFDRDDGGLLVGNSVGRFRCDALGALIESWSVEDSRKNGDVASFLNLNR